MHLSGQFHITVISQEGVSLVGFLIKWNIKFDLEERNVGGRYFAEFGLMVLHIDSPKFPEIFIYEWVIGLAEIFSRLHSDWLCNVMYVASKIQTESETETPGRAWNQDGGRETSLICIQIYHCDICWVIPRTREMPSDDMNHLVMLRRFTSSDIICHMSKWQLIVD